MWIILALLNPAAEAFRNLFGKKASRLGIDPLMLSWVNFIIPVILFLPLLFFIKIVFNTEFFIAVVISGVINIWGIILYMKAIAEGDLSEVVPMLSFTPLFLLFTSPIIIGEFPHFYGVCGVILIAVGSYLLNINLRSEGFYAPLKALIKSKGTRYMLIVAFIWSISSNYDKVGIKSSSIIQYTFFMNLFVQIGVTIITINKHKFALPKTKEGIKQLLLVGITSAASTIFHLVAITLTLVTYIVALKRTSGMMSIILGHLFLKEPNVRERFIGAFIMFLGVVLILLS